MPTRSRPSRSPSGRTPSASPPLTPPRRSSPGSLRTAPPRDLAAATRAWRHGGTASLDVLESSWIPPASRLERDREALRADWADGRPPRLRAWRNRWTVEGRDAQLRLGWDELWYPYAKEQGIWWPSGPPDADPAVVLTALLET